MGSEAILHGYIVFFRPKRCPPIPRGRELRHCHASFHPLRPPKSIVNPDWTNLSGNIGAQYLRIRVAFGNLLTKDQFVYHLLDSQPPGTIDTSLIASDNINNPNTMNAVFDLPARAILSFRNPPRSIARQCSPPVAVCGEGTGKHGRRRTKRWYSRKNGLAAGI